MRSRRRCRRCRRCRRRWPLLACISSQLLICSESALTAERAFRRFEEEGEATVYSYASKALKSVFLLQFPRALAVLGSYAYLGLLVAMVNLAVVASVTEFEKELPQYKVKIT